MIFLIYYQAVTGEIKKEGSKDWSVAINNLEAGISYQFVVIASNKQGSSPPSKPLSIKTQDGKSTI